MRKISDTNLVVASDKGHFDAVDTMRKHRILP